MRVSLYMNTCSTVNRFVVEHSVPSWTCYCWSSAYDDFYEMPHTPVGKCINPLTPITYTAGALLAKQMNGELCIPEAASLLGVLLSVPHSSRIVCALRGTAKQTALNSAGGMSVALQPLKGNSKRDSFLAAVHPVSTSAKLYHKPCKVDQKLQPQTANSWIASGKAADCACGDNWQSLHYCFSLKICLEGRSECALVNWNIEQWHL